MFNYTQTQTHREIFEEHKIVEALRKTKHFIDNIHFKYLCTNSRVQTCQSYSDRMQIDLAE